MTGQISVELKILGYLFPDKTDFDGSNRLMILLEMQSPWGLWSRNDPCLEVLEAQRLLHWFQEVERHFDFFAGWKTSHLDSSECFIEPNLEFWVRGGQVIPRPEGTLVMDVLFSHEFLPPFSSELPHDMLLEEEKVHQVLLRFYLTHEQLKTLIRQWEQDMTPFPERYSKEKW